MPNLIDIIRTQQRHNELLVYRQKILNALLHRFSTAPPDREEDLFKPLTVLLTTFQIPELKPYFPLCVAQLQRWEGFPEQDRVLLEKLLKRI